MPGKPDDGFENIPTPEFKRGATSQDGQPPGNEGFRDDAEPSIGESEPDAADDGEQSTKTDNKNNAPDARVAAAEAANAAMRAKMLELENQIYRMDRDAEYARIQNERERERGIRRIEEAMKPFETANVTQPAAASPTAPAPGTIPGATGPQKAAGDNAKDTLPDKLTPYLCGDLARMWLTTARNTLPRSLKAVLNKTIETGCIAPAWSNVLPPLSAEERRKCEELDEE